MVMTSGNHTVCLAWLPHMVKLFPATIYCSYFLLCDIRKNYIRCLGSQNPVNGNTSGGWLLTHKNGLATVKNESQFKLNSFTVISYVRVIMCAKKSEVCKAEVCTSHHCLGTIHWPLLGHNIVVSLGRPSFCTIHMLRMNSHTLLSCQQKYGANSIFLWVYAPASSKNQKRETALYRIKVRGI